MSTIGFLALTHAAATAFVCTPALISPRLTRTIVRRRARASRPPPTPSPSGATARSGTTPRSPAWLSIAVASSESHRRGSPTSSGTPASEKPSTSWRVRSPNATPTTARRNGLDEPGPCSGPFHAAQAHPAEAPQVKDACEAGLLGGGGVCFLPAALRDRGQTGRPRSTVALARRVEHGSCLPVAGQDLELLQAAPQAVPATSRPAS